MTPELSKEIIVGCVAAATTALFTGVPAAMLFWWTWRRDQERIVVQKLIPNWSTLKGQWVTQKDGFGPVINILVRNRSLFPVYVSEFGFLIDREVIEVESPRLYVKMKKNRDALNSAWLVPDEDFDPYEIPSQQLTTVNVDAPADRKRIIDAVTEAAKRRNASVEKILLSPKVVAIVVLQSGNEFTSESFRRRNWRKAKWWIKKRRKSARR